MRNKNIQLLLVIRVKNYFPKILLYIGCSNSMELYLFKLKLIQEIFFATLLRSYE